MYFFEALKYNESENFGKRKWNESYQLSCPHITRGACIFGNIGMTRMVLAEAGIEAEIVAVDDGSSDNTFDEIKRAVESYGNVVAASNPYNIGKRLWR